RLTFLMPVPLALLALAAGWKLIPRIRPARAGRHDPVGAITLPLGMILTVYAVVTAPTQGWASPAKTGTLALILAAILLTAFVLTERRLRHPLIRLGILRHTGIVRACLSIVALLGTYMSFQFMLTLYLQQNHHWSPLQTACALLPAGITVAAGSLTAGQLLTRFGTAPLIRASMAATALGYAWFLATAGTTPSYPATMLPSLLLLGTGFALGYSAIMAQATQGIPSHEQGLASGLVQTSAMAGTALILAAVTTTLTGHPAHTLSPYRTGLTLITGIALLGLIINLTPTRTPRNPD
ncbi:MFS transporter, partial [Streptomyces erythrochromogenes]